MKILQIHKYYSKKRGGGSVAVFFELIKLLSLKGHKVSIFSMQDTLNEKSFYDKYFTSHFDLNEKMSFWKKIKLIPKIIYNLEAKKNIEKLIINEKPDIAHLHNIYHYLSPSIIDSLKKHNIPIVMTLHAYKEICPNYKLFVKGKICEKCKDGKYYNCLLNKCLKNSFAKSFIATVEAYFHKFRKTYEKVDIFISPSQFLKEKYVEFGIPQEKIKVLRYHINFSDYAFKDETFAEDNYFLCYGRLAEEKGINDLILATKTLKDSGDLKNNLLCIVGHGPEELKLKKTVSELDLENEIKFLGFKQGEELKKIITHSKFTTLPSVWYDNSPLVISETQLFGKPIIVSDLGGSKESIIKNKTGIIFEAGNIPDLAEKIKAMLNLSREERKKMGQLGAQNIRKIHTEDTLYQKLINLYTGLLCNNLPK